LFVVVFAISYKENSDFEQFSNIKTCFWTVPPIRTKLYVGTLVQQEYQTGTKYAHQMCGKFNGNEDLRKTYRELTSLIWSI